MSFVIASYSLECKFLQVETLPPAAVILDVISTFYVHLHSNAYVAAPVLPAGSRSSSRRGEPEFPGSDALLNFAAFQSEIWAADSTAGEHAQHWHRLGHRAGGCGSWVGYLQLGKQLLKQHIKAAVFNVAESAEDTGFIVVRFCHVFLCVVSAGKYQQGQNYLSSKERERNSEVSKPSSAHSGVPPLCHTIVRCLQRKEQSLFFWTLT